MEHGMVVIQSDVVQTPVSLVLYAGTRPKGSDVETVHLVSLEMDLVMAVSPLVVAQTHVTLV